jgi:hypothetical protein
LTYSRAHLRAYLCVCARACPRRCMRVRVRASKCSSGHSLPPDRSTGGTLLCWRPDCSGAGHAAHAVAVVAAYQVRHPALAACGIHAPAQAGEGAVRARTRHSSSELKPLQSFRLRLPVRSEVQSVLWPQSLQRNSRLLRQAKPSQAKPSQGCGASRSAISKPIVCARTNSQRPPNVLPCRCIRCAGVPAARHIQDVP